MKPEILFEDAQVIVCRKPAGVPVQTARVGAPDMVSLLKNHIYRATGAGKEPYLAVIHRLDQPVQGLLVFAKTPEAAKELNRQLQGPGFGKYYQAILCGKPQQESGRCSDYLVRDARSNTSQVCRKDTPGAKLAVLDYEVLRTLETEDGVRTVVRIKLETGRHHQIRVQMAHMGCPIEGDTKYNPSAKDKAGWQEIKLCAYRLEFRHPKTKKPMKFELECLDK